MDKSNQIVKLINLSIRDGPTQGHKMDHEQLFILCPKVISMQ